MDRMLRLPEVLAAVGVSSVTLWRWERAGRFPRRRRIGPNAVAWRASEVKEWIDGRARVPTPSSPAPSGGRKNP